MPSINTFVRAVQYSSDGRSSQLLSSSARQSAFYTAQLVPAVGVAVSLDNEDLRGRAAMGTSDRVVEFWEAILCTNSWPTLKS